MRRLLSKLPTTPSQFAGLGEVEIAAPLDENDIAEAVIETTQAFGVLTGRWRIEITNIVTYRDEWGPQFGINMCETGFNNSQLGLIREAPIPQEILDAFGTLSNGIYGSPLSDHAPMRNKEVALGAVESVLSLQVISPTRATLLETWNVYGTSANAQPGVFICEFTSEWVRVGD